MQKVTIKEITENKSPKFVKTKMVKAEREDGREMNWEMIDSHDSVHILVDNPDKECLMFVKQVRIPALVNNPDTNGECLECCAGLVDKDCSVEQIAKEEILEEMGYDIPLEQISFERKYLSSVGTQATNVYCYSAEVFENQKDNDGGGLESEDIEVISIPYDKVFSFIYAGDSYENTFTDSTTLFLCTTWLLGREVFSEDTSENNDVI